MSSQDIYNWQYNSNPIYVPDRNNTNILVVIAKPTRVCNADCSYCSSPPLEEMGSNWEPEWNFETFKNYFDKVFPYMPRLYLSDVHFLSFFPNKHAVLNCLHKFVHLLG